MVQLSITKVRKSNLGLDLKCLFKPNANFNNMVLTPQVQRKCIPDLGSAEPDIALILSCPS